MIDSPYRTMIRDWRRERLHLSARTRTTLTTTPDGHTAPAPLHAWSQQLLPAPADWPSAAAPIGDWVLPAEPGWTPPVGLARFLEAGDPPIYIGFGSMVGRDPAGLSRSVIDALQAARTKAVLATGWGGLRPNDDLGPDVYVVDHVPHDWLMPRVTAVVHHGGAGTVHAAARAGRPQVIRPFLGDQPFWANRVHRAGLGPAPLTGRLTSERLATAITTAIGDRSLGQRAGAVAAAMSKEDGIAAAIQRLEALSG